MARPKKEIDFNELDKLCHIQCTAEEIAAWFECTVETIEARIRENFGIGFLEYYAEKRGIGKISLRRRQFQKAMDGCSTMLIWTGKQYLNQKDKQEIEQDIKSNGQQIQVYIPDNQRSE